MLETIRARRCAALHQTLRDQIVFLADQTFHLLQLSVASKHSKSHSSLAGWPCAPTEHMPANSAAASRGRAGACGNLSGGPMGCSRSGYGSKRNLGDDESHHGDSEDLVELAGPPLLPLSEIKLADGRKVEEVAAELMEKDKPLFMQIDPRRSKFIMIWDVVTTVALMFTATVTPVEVALMEPSLDTLFVINRLVDVVFALDIVLTFFTMYEVVSFSINKTGLWVTNRWMIARHYLLGWFALDVFSVGVSTVDILSVIQSGGSMSGTKGGAGVSALKTLRILRLFKLVRLLRSSRIAARWETRVAVDYAMVEIFKCILKVIFCSHWMACAWCLQAHMTHGGPLGDLSSDNPIASWLGEEGYCVADASTTNGYRCDAWSDIYAGAVYWSVMTITSIGYGDIAATPRNSFEMMIAVILMMVSSLIWASVIGTYCGVVATLNPDLAAFHEMIQDLNRFMLREQLAPELQFRLREYFHRSKHLRLANAQQRLLLQMPPTLRGEVAWETCRTWLSSIYFLRGAPKEFMVELALELQAMVFAPNDQPDTDHLYVVHAGIALYQAKLVTKGQCFGEDVILVSSHLRARAMDYLEVFYVGRTELLHVAARYPAVARSIRRAAILIALRREMILTAKMKLGMSQDEKLSALGKLVSKMAMNSHEQESQKRSLLERHCCSEVSALGGGAAAGRQRERDSSGKGAGSERKDGLAKAPNLPLIPEGAQSNSPASNPFFASNIFASTPKSAEGASTSSAGSAPPPSPMDSSKGDGSQGGVTASQLNSIAAMLQTQHRKQIEELKAELKATHALVEEGHARIVEMLLASRAPGTTPSATERGVGMGRAGLAPSPAGANTLGKRSVASILAARPRRV